MRISLLLPTINPTISIIYIYHLIGPTSSADPALLGQLADLSWRDGTAVRPFLFLFFFFFFFLFLFLFFLFLFFFSYFSSTKLFLLLINFYFVMGRRHNRHTHRHTDVHTKRRVEVYSIGVL